MAKSKAPTASTSSSSMFSVGSNSQNCASISPAASLAESTTNIMKRRTKTAGKTNISLGTTDRRKRVAANARERKRMHLLNSAYDKLRKRLADAENKSKYDVLVQAKEYIQALARICKNHDKAQVATSNSSTSEGCQDSRDREGSHQKPVSRDKKYTHQTGAINDYTIKLESPQSIAESHYTEVDIDCCSPIVLTSPCLSLPDSARSPIAGNTTFPYRTSHRGQQQVPENLSCSTILNSPPPATNHYHYSDCTMPALRPDYSPPICQTVKHQQLSRLNLTNASDIYHQYTQAFQYIQRAT